LIQSVAETFSYNVLEIHEMLAMSPAFDVVGLALSIKKQCVVLRDGNQQLLVVLSDPFDINILPWLSAKIESPFSCALTLRGELLAYLSKQEESVRAVDQIIVEESKEITLPQNSAPILSFSSVSADSSPAVKLVNSTLYDALKAGASDVHIESSSHGLTVRYRIDGVLGLVTNASGSEISEQVISRIKVLAELDIAERRVPQDGSFRVRIEERDIDLRVSVMPSIHGEDAVIRILDKRK
jgi:general secretion pathway protein E